MRAIEAKTYSGYDGLQQIESAKPQRAKDKILVCITGAGVTPLPPIFHPEGSASGAAIRERNQ